MKTPSERGVTGAWAYLARQEAGLSVEQVAEQMGAKGVTVSAATIRGIESGSKKPGARMLRTLGAVLESVPPGAAIVRDEQADSTSRLADAAERQAAAAEEANRIALEQLDATRAQTAALQALLLGSLDPDQETRARLLRLARSEVLSAIPTRSGDPTPGHHAAPAR